MDSSSIQEKANIPKCYPPITTLKPYRACCQLVDNQLVPIDLVDV